MQSLERSAGRKSGKKSLFLFGVGLALQCIILLATVPGTASQSDPAELCFTNCVSISVASTANVLASANYTSTYTIDINSFANPITTTRWVGGLLGDAQFVKVEPNQGLVVVNPITYSWAVVNPLAPLVLTTTVQATNPGLHTLTLGRVFTSTAIAEVETSTLVTESLLPFTLSYNIPLIAPVGVITETYTLTAATDVITKTVVTGLISSLAGRFLSVVGSEPGLCGNTELTFDCTVPYSEDLREVHITITSEVQEMAQLVRDLKVEGGAATLPLRFTSRAHPIQTDIDIKPGGEPNTIRIGRPHSIAVAILSTATLRPVDHVDVATLAFGPTGFEAGPTSCAPEHVNADAVLDIVCHFDGMKAGFELGDTLGRLSGRTLPSAAFLSGLPIAGQDSVRIIDPGEGSGSD